jgi:hypothetical protein
MKRLYCLAFALFSGVLIYGQTTVDPTEVSVFGIESSDLEGVGYSTLYNNSENEKTYTWQRNVLQITEGWTSAICDLNQCYLAFTNSAELILPGNGQSNLDVHAYPNGNPGFAVIEVLVTNNEDATDFASGIFYFNTTLSISERISDALKIYPNPAVSDFFIEGGEAVERIEIYSLEGKLVKQENIQGRGSVNVSDLQSGNYILRMWDQSNTQISSNVLTIR